MNILQAQSVANSMNTEILRPKFPRREGKILLMASMILTLSALGHAQNSAPAPVEIVNLEQHLWTTMAEGDFATMRSLFTKDFIEVDDKIQAVDALLVNLKHCKLQAYELRDLQVRILSPDSALTAYHMVSTFNCGTGDKPQVKNYDNNATTTWVRQPDKKWLVQAHTETPVTPAK
jgi:uncharacterized protein (TIGR02246 family)